LRAASSIATAIPKLAQFLHSGNELRRKSVVDNDFEQKKEWICGFPHPLRRMSHRETIALL
jgi:hypothetical protein